MREHNATAPASSTQINETIGRLNRRALHLARPGPNWLLSSIKIGLAVKAASILLSVLVSAAYYAFGVEAAPPTSRGLVHLVIVALVLAPWIETLQIMVVHALTRRWLGISGFLAASTTLAYLSHGPESGFPIVAAFAFLAMSYQYVAFRESLGTGRAFAGVTVSHLVCNGVAVLLWSIKLWFDA